MRTWERADIACPEGRFPIVLRRDGTLLPPGSYFVLSLYDPNAAPALEAYATAAAGHDLDENYVADLRDLAVESIRLSSEHPEECHPDRGPHRVDHPLVLRWHDEGWSLKRMLAYWCAAAPVP